MHNYLDDAPGLDWNLTAAQQLPPQSPPTITLSGRGKGGVIVRHDSLKKPLMNFFKLPIPNNDPAIPPCPGVIVEGNCWVIAGPARSMPFAIPH